MTFKVQEKINNYLATHSDLKGKSEQVILSAMMTNGIISRAEYEQACKNSAFGTGFLNKGSMGLTIEHTQPVQEAQNIEQIGDYIIEDENNKIKSKKAKDGSSETTYTYLKNDDGVEFAIIHTKLADGTEITTTALNVNPETGEVNNTDFLNRVTTKPDGTTIVVTNDFNLNGLLREVIITPDKTTTNIYNDTDIDKYDNKAQTQLNRLAQNIEINGHTYNVRYDGEGNTYVVLQNGDCPERLIRDFKVSKKQLDQLNKGNFDYNNMQVGGIIRIPNEIAADDKSIKNRKTSQESQQAFFNWSVKHEQADMLTCTISDYTIKRKHTSVESLAREILPDGSKEQIRTLALRLQMINKDLVKRLNAGEEITIALEGDKTSTEAAKAAGFAPTKENHAFYQVLNGLSKENQQKAIAVIQECKRAKITDLTEIKKRVFAKTGISLFDSGKTIKSGNTTKPIELALKENLGCNNPVIYNIIYSRFAAIQEEYLKDFDINTIKANLKGDSLNDYLKAFEVSGLSLLTPDEIKNNKMMIDKDHAYPIEDMSMVRMQNFSIQVIRLLFDNAISIYQQYLDNMGALDKFGESIAKNLDKGENPENGLHSIKNNIDLLKRQKKMVLDYLENNQVSTIDESKLANFKNVFKQATGREFDETKITKFMDLVANNTDPNSSQYQTAFKNAFGSQLVDFAAEYVDKKQMLSSFTSMGMQIATLICPAGRALTGFIGTKVGNIAANGIMMGGTTAVFEGVDLMVKDAPVTRNDILNYVQSVAISTGFGAYAAYMTPAFQKTCASVSTKAAKLFPKIFKAPDIKKIEAVTKTLEHSKSINGTELMAQYLSTGSNIAGKTAEFLREIVVFSGYSIAAGTITEFAKLAFDTDGTLKSQYSNEDSLLDLITKELGHQIEGLTSCKALTKILMAFCSKKNTQAGMMQDQLKSFETLKNIDFKYTEINGQKVLIVQTPKGNIKINSPAEAVNLCQQLALTESVILMDKSIQEKKPSKIQGCKISSEQKNILEDQLKGFDRNTRELLLKFLENETIVIDEVTETEVMRIQFSNYTNIPKDKIIVYSPRPDGDKKPKSYDRSGERFSDVNNIPKENISRDLKNIPEDATIFMPDDCSLTGSSMILDLLTNLPKNFKGTVVFAPTVKGVGRRNSGEKGLADESLSLFQEIINNKNKLSPQQLNEKIQELSNLISDNKPANKKKLNDLLENYQDTKIEIAESIEAKTYKETDTYKNMSKEEQQTFDRIASADGANIGYGNCATSIIFSCSGKGPNNNLGIMELFNACGMQMKPSAYFDYQTSLNLMLNDRVARKIRPTDIVDKGQKYNYITIGIDSNNDIRIPTDMNPKVTITVEYNGKLYTVEYQPAKITKNGIIDNVFIADNEIFALERSALPKLQDKKGSYQFEGLSMPRGAKIVKVNNIDVDIWKVYTQKSNKVSILNEKIQNLKEYVLDKLKVGTEEYNNALSEYNELCRDFEQAYQEYCEFKTSNNILDINLQRINDIKKEFEDYKRKRKFYTNKIKKEPDNLNYQREYNTWNQKYEDLKNRIQNDNILRMEININDNN